MPLFKNKKGELVYLLNPNELTTPLKQGYYAEVIVKLDSNIDALLDALVQKRYSKDCCRDFLKQIESGMKRHYSFVSGLVKARILKDPPPKNRRVRSISIGKEIYNKICRFKEKRNKILHSEKGHYALIVGEVPSSREKFEKNAKDEIKKVVNLGMDIYIELGSILLKHSKYKGLDEPELTPFT